MNNCTKLWKGGKLWKFNKVKTRERKSFDTARATITRQVVTCAESPGTGIKFEKLFSAGYPHREPSSHTCEFSFESGSFSRCNGWLRDGHMTGEFLLSM